MIKQSPFSFFSMTLCAIIWLVIALSIFSSKFKSILNMIEKAAQLGEIGGLEIEYWDRGGPPGQGFESDHIVFKSIHGQPVEVYTRTKFDNSYEPPFLAEEFSHMIDRQVIQQVATQLLQLRVFESSFPEENDPHIGDVTEISITARSDGNEVSNLYYDHIPTQLKAIEELFRYRMKVAAESSKPKVLHRKK